MNRHISEFDRVNKKISRIKKKQKELVEDFTIRHKEELEKIAMSFGTSSSFHRRNVYSNLYGMFTKERNDE